MKSYFCSKIYSVLGGFSLVAIGNFLGHPIGKQIEGMMNMYQSVLASIGVSIDNIDKICSNFSRKGIGAKLTGSGCCGDVLIFSSDPNKKRILNKLLAKRATNVISNHGNLNLFL